MNVCQEWQRNYIIKEGYNWQEWASDGQVAGTTGQSKRIEAIEIVTEGMPEGYYLQYRVLVQDYGWMRWVNEGETAGTINEWRRIEAIQIRIVKGESTIKYRTHLADTMWQDWRYNGQMSGTVNQYRRKRSKRSVLAHKRPCIGTGSKEIISRYEMCDWTSNR